MKKKQEDMRLEFENSKLKFYIGDVRDIRSLDNAMMGVDYVFHAAALKQVPSCEFYPIEAIKTNVLGAENVIVSAMNNSVKKCVMLSTDKAVHPVNAMGMSKGLMEKVMIAYSKNNTERFTLCATRYGNVMGSRGSVIPLFIKQIKNGNPCTITDPNMTRFLMSLYDSVDLVLYAFENGNPGDILVQKSPSSTVHSLASALMKLCGKKVNTKVIGTRHGEKKHEILVSKEEMARSEDLGAYYRISCDNRDLNYNKYELEGDTQINEIEEYNSANTTVLSDDEIVKLIESLPYLRRLLND